MQKKQSKIFTVLTILLCALTSTITACGNNEKPPVESSTLPVEIETQYIVVTATPSPSTNTPDPCAPENIEAEVQKIHKFMREFDDASTLAGNIMKSVNNGQMQMSDLSAAIPNLQSIRRDTEDQPTPSCLVNLKTYQINHMNSVLNSLNAFLAGDQQGFDKSVLTARDQHDKYTLELARLLGLTVEPATSTTPEQTPNP